MTTKELLNTNYSFNSQDLFSELQDAICKLIKINMVTTCIKARESILQNVKHEGVL